MAAKKSSSTSKAALRRKYEERAIERRREEAARLKASAVAAERSAQATNEVARFQQEQVESLLGLLIDIAGRAQLHNITSEATAAVEGIRRKVGEVDAAQSALMASHAGAHKSIAQLSSRVDDLNNQARYTDVDELRNAIADVRRIVFEVKREIAGVQEALNVVALRTVDCAHGRHPWEPCPDCPEHVDLVAVAAAGPIPIDEIDHYNDPDPHADLEPSTVEPVND